jgi:DNA-binding NtrC family response regulator
MNFSSFTIARPVGIILWMPMSGFATNEVAIKARKEGIQSFLAKPFTSPELLNLLAELCGDRQSKEVPAVSAPTQSNECCENPTLKPSDHES